MPLLLQKWGQKLLKNLHFYYLLWEVEKPNCGITWMEWPQVVSAAVAVGEINFLVGLLSVWAAGLPHHAAAFSAAAQNNGFRCDPQRSEVVQVWGTLDLYPGSTKPKCCATSSSGQLSVTLFPGYERAGPPQVGTEPHRKGITGEVLLHLV